MQIALTMFYCRVSMLRPLTGGSTWAHPEVPGNYRRRKLRITASEGIRHCGFRGFSTGKKNCSYFMQVVACLKISACIGDAFGKKTNCGKSATRIGLSGDASPLSSSSLDSTLPVPHSGPGVTWVQIPAEFIQTLQHCFPGLSKSQGFPGLKCAISRPVSSPSGVRGKTQENLKFGAT